ncbi:NADH:flavin oxidoreductase/NADH oxidase family protein [Rhizobium rhizogenes]|uniref:NADH:flavin oxidoreductase/NADH oxidase family protein n=1 Tax=Rhizobium rhizogenes TaxID=359 RepID=UPI001296776D|nr:NADH:flavin oxidoreductase/NADH oxidase family protein [Rhizobium rhizogenes]MQB34279.1 2,4-dienoyl-CoA reductase [Rhizobium rhizogenes]
MSQDPLFQPLVLPNGAVIPNRIAKASMEENLADENQAPGDALLRMYRGWAEGGAGLILTGNVMIDGRAMTGPGGVVVDSRSSLAALHSWAKVATSRGAQFWMQINHPGRQMMASLKQETIAPSAVPLSMGRFSKMFPIPRAMTERDIQEVIARFVETAAIAEEAGFTGVEIHAAHGYLLSQFLSPLTNRRTDKWGGSLRNRARILVEIVRDVRDNVSPGFCVAVKLNSADFQRGGFGESDAIEVVRQLNELGVDLVEISGGSYESPAMQGHTQDERTLAREAYFLEFAREIVAAARMPVMLTGGIRRKSVAEYVLADGIAMIGMATALALRPDLPNAWRRGEEATVEAPHVSWKSKPLASLAIQSVVKTQMRRLSQGKAPSSHISPALALARTQITTACRTRQYVAWAASQAETQS